MCLPVSRISAALVCGIWRGRRTAEPIIGYSDHRASDTPKRALRPATRMSVPRRISVPPAMATPSTAAMIGFVGRPDLRKPRSMNVGSSFIRCVRSNDPSSSGSPAIARRSAPDEKLPSAPVRMMQRMSSSALASAQASAMIASIVPVKALSRFGRFRVSCRIGPSRSTSTGGTAQSLVERSTPMAKYWAAPP